MPGGEVPEVDVSAGERLDDVLVDTRVRVPPAALDVARDDEVAGVHADPDGVVSRAAVATVAVHVQDQVDRAPFAVAAATYEADRVAVPRVRHVRDDLDRQAAVVAQPAPALQLRRVLITLPGLSCAAPATLPDLVALPLWGMNAMHRKSGGDFLAFAATPWNAGPAPLVVEGFRQPAEEVMDTYQYFCDAEGSVVGRAPVGEMRFHPHPAHDH
jgi:hypothetical protein